MQGFGVAEMENIHNSFYVTYLTPTLLSWPVISYGTRRENEQDVEYEAGNARPAGDSWR